MEFEVFFTANKPAVRATSNTSPFGTVLFKIACIVADEPTFTIAWAVAVRWVIILWVISTIRILNFRLNDFRFTNIAVYLRQFAYLFFRCLWAIYFPSIAFI